MQIDQNVYVEVEGKETIGIIRSLTPQGDYNVAIEGKCLMAVKNDQIRLLKNTVSDLPFSIFVIYLKRFERISSKTVAMESFLNSEKFKLQKPLYLLQKN